MDTMNQLRTPHEESHEELAAGFALGTLDATDLGIFRDHLPNCPVCQRLVREYSSVAGLIPNSLAEIDPSPELRQRLLEAARADTLPTDRPAAQAEAATAEPARIDARPARRSSSRAVVWALPLAALVTIVFGLGYWNYQLRQRIATQSALIELQHQALLAVAAGGQQWALAGTQSAPQAHGVLLQAPTEARPVLVVRGLGELPAGQSYQAWVITGGQPVGAGLLESDGRGGQVARLDRPLGSADTVAVTIEPAGGRPAPTGPIVVAGNI